MSFTITYDRAIVASACERFDPLFADPSQDHLDVLRHLLVEVSDLAGTWSAVDRPDLNPRRVEAEFYGAGHQTIIVYLPGGSWQTAGITQLSALSLSADTAARLTTALGVLDAVVETVNETIRQGS